MNPKMWLAAPLLLGSHLCGASYTWVRADTASSALFSAEPECAEKALREATDLGITAVELHGRLIWFRVGQDQWSNFQLTSLGAASCIEAGMVGWFKLDADGAEKIADLESSVIKRVLRECADSETSREAPIQRAYFLGVGDIVGNDSKCRGAPVEFWAAPDTTRLNTDAGGPRESIEKR